VFFGLYQADRFFRALHCCKGLGGYSQKRFPVTLDFFWFTRLRQDSSGVLPFAFCSHQWLDDH
jgi:hypothetical protein